MSEYSLPSKDKSLFVSGNYMYKAHIPKTTPLELIDKYIQGYKFSAEAAIESFIKNSYLHSYKDSIIFPIIFNYRQMIELLLKKYYLKYDIAPTFKNLDHKLVPMWELVEEHFIKAYSNVDPEDLKEKTEGVRKYLEEFDSIDKDSFVFRYPFKRNANFTSTIITEQHIDVLNLKARMDELYNFLEYAEDHLLNMK